MSTTKEERGVERVIHIIFRPIDAHKNRSIGNTKLDEGVLLVRLFTCLE